MPKSTLLPSPGPAAGSFAPEPAAPPDPPSPDLAAAPPEALPVAILGVAFDPVTIASAADRIEAMINERRPRYVVTPNVDFLVQARHDAALHQILALADLVLCDGKPLVWASQWLGNPLPGRVAGSDLTPVLLERAAQRGWKLFLLGGADGAGAEAARRIAQAHPTLPPVAHYAPPHAPLAGMDHAEILARVRAAQPDLMLVCFGCPKQEKWIFRHYRERGMPVMIGAGGTVDFLAGRIARAPRWMRQCGAEWLFRLAQEPRRLFKRYAIDLLQFGPALLRQLWHLPPGPAETMPANQAASSASMSYGLKVQAGERLQRDALQEAPGFWTEALQQQPGHCLLDLAEVKAIDSTGLAFLAHWQRRLAEVRRNLILLRPSPAVCAALELMRLTGHFVITDGALPGAFFPGGRGPQPVANGRL